MKAVVLHQPYATLVALGVKKIETRPAPPNGPMRPAGVRGLPGLALERGERIAIVAGGKPPKWATLIGDYAVVRGPFLRRRYDVAGPADFSSLPLGAVVCTVVVKEAVPMVDFDDFDEWTWDETWPHGVIVGDFDRDDDLCRFGPGTDMFIGEDIPDQLPYGDFAPGRWGWLLTDVRACAPVPVKGKQGVFLLPEDVAEQVS